MDPAGARAALRARRAEAEQRLADLRRSHADVVAAAEGSNGDDEHDVEGTTIASSRAQIAALMTTAETTLAELDAAIGRLDDGGYGRCVGCGGPIGEARLEARPSADRCITCAGRR